MRDYSYESHEGHRFHYKARVYNPKLGRFLQTDPIFYADNMNMYAYVGNDPMNLVDPTGEASLLVAIAYVVVAAAAGYAIYKGAVAAEKFDDVTQNASDKAQKYNDTLVDYGNGGDVSASDIDKAGLEQIETNKPILNATGELAEATSGVLSISAPSNATEAVTQAATTIIEKTAEAVDDVVKEEDRK